MATLQVKNLPDNVHAALRQRADAFGMTMSAYVIQLLQRDLIRLTTAEWIAQVEEATKDWPVRDLNAVAILDEIRGPWPGEEP